MFIQETANGELFVAYVESGVFGKALDMFAASREPFDIWFKQELAGVTGVDLNDPPPGPLSALISHDEV